MQLKFVVETKALDLLKSSNVTTVLCGAGLSSDSGIPTFRGKDGYWRAGSKNYMPEELATYTSFNKMPKILFKWYEERRNFCRNAKPNPGHQALVELEQYYNAKQKEFGLITQNVDGLSKRAGSLNQFEIHGNIFKVRCSAKKNCKSINEIFDYSERQEKLSNCKSCNSILRPHVLWFDETYNEVLFSAESAVNFALRSDLLLLIGTTLLTSLPHSIVLYLHGRNVPIIEINPEPTIEAYATYTFKQSASIVLPKLVQALLN